MPWTELNRLLADVTAGFAAAASSRAPVTNLVDRGVSFVCEASHAGEWPPPSQRQRAALLQGLAELGARLAAVSTPLKAALASPGTPAEQQEEAGQQPPLAPPKLLLRWLKALLALPPEAFAAGKYCNALGYGECSVPAAQSKLHRRACCWLPI